MKAVLTITKREFMTFLNSPTAYVVAVAYLLPSYFLFWQTTLFNGEATMRDFFNLWPWFLMLLASALTMRAFAEEKRRQTLDLLLAHPVKEWQVVAGKFFGAWGFLTLLLLVTMSLPLTVGNLSEFDWGQAMGGYLGAWLSGGAAIALGLLVSAWTSNVISSFLVSAALIFVWTLIGLDFVLVTVPGTVGSVLTQLGVITHLTQMTRGVIFVRDIVFFAVFGLLALGLATVKLMEPKTTENKLRRRNLYLGAVMFAVAGVIINQVLDAWPWRLDLSRGGLYSLSVGTKTTLSNLDDVVNITLYTSRQLPAGQTQLTARFTKDLLDDYVRYGQGNVRLSVLYPESDPTLAQRAAEDGVRQVNFNSISSGRLELQAGYLGVAVAYGGKKEAVQFVSDAGNLEYEITRRIRKLVSSEPKTIGLVGGNGEKTRYTDYSLWAQTLETEYTLEDVNMSEDNANLQDYSALLVIGTTEAPTATASAAMSEYLADGGRAMFLLDRIQPNYQLGIGSPVTSGWEEALSEYGISINADLVYDVENNEPVPLESGPLRYLLPYPFWINSVTNKDFSPIGGVGVVTVGWASSIEIMPRENVNIVTLLTTGRDGGAMVDTFTIQPEQAPQVGGGKEYTLAVAGEKPTSKVVVVGDSELVTDMFAQYKTANVAFLSNLVDWLTLGDGEQMVARKDFSPAILQVKSAQQLMAAQYGNIVGVPVAVAVGGAYWLRRRKKLAQRKYEL